MTEPRARPAAREHPDGPRIAVIGMACRYPDARTPAELWENVLAERRAFRRMPRERLDLDDYLSSDPHDLDSIYSGQAAVLEGWTFDRERFRIAGPTFRQVDLAHWLALEVAADALRDAGFAHGQGLPRDTTGVIVGNTLTGEFSRANTLRLRWPYVRRVTDAALRERGVADDTRRELLDGLERRFKAPFPQMGEESLAGGLSNTIAGRVCNYFDLKGGGYTVDGACAASLLALANACTLLEAGDLDVAIAGGVDLSLDPFELVGFSRAGALARDQMRVYDARSAGFWPGEGCGFVVLMRHADALARGLRPYAMVRGWGVASDGSGGITRPEAAGQLLAVQRAYRRAGFDIDTVGYLEGHGTGTQVGDEVELGVLSRARREAGADAPRCPVGSVKALIGHTKAAAGIAGFIKATLALHHEIVPPTAGCSDPHPLLGAADAPLYAERSGEVWPAGRPLRAGVSAMGFGGIDTHVVVEGARQPQRAGFTREEALLLSTPQDAELFRFGAADRVALRTQVRAVLAYAARLSLAELGDVAAALDPPADAAVRGAVVASDPAELDARLRRLDALLEVDAAPALEPGSGVYLGAVKAARIGFLFPGQGSPSHYGGGAWRRRFPFARAAWEALGVPAGADPRDTRHAQGAIVAASAVALRVLSDAGIEAIAGVGHSLGELTALHWAGAFDRDAVVRLAQARGRAMADLGRAGGAMASLATDADRARDLIEGTHAVIAGLNAPRQTVVSGAHDDVSAVIAHARAAGIGAVALPVSHAFHSPHVAAAAGPLRTALERETLAPVARRVYSTIAARALAPHDAVCDLLLDQLVTPVRFTEAFVLADREVDLWIEVGPGSVLSGLASLQGRAPAFAIDAGGPGVSGLLHAIGAAWAIGAPVQQRALFGGRFVRPFDLDWQPQFLANPCEAAPLEHDEGARGKQPRLEFPATVRDDGGADLAAATNGSHDAAPESGGGPVIEIVRALVAEHTELPVGAVADSHGLLRDLHLNSIVVGQIAAETARRIGLPPPVDPTAWAGASVGELALAIEELRASGPRTAAAPAEIVSGIDGWVRAFEVRLVESPQAERPAGSAHPGGASWKVFALPGDTLAPALERGLERAGGRGVVACMPPAADERCADLLLDAVQALWPERHGATFAVVERDGGGGGAFARTLRLESPDTAVCVVGVPADDTRAEAWAVDEIAGAAGFVEAHYGRDGVRRTPQLAMLDTHSAPSLDHGTTARAAPALGENDVLLVTGGGKGIAAECALDLVRGTGARLAIVGRARPEDDAALAHNLERFAAAGVACAYAAADVTDEAALGRALAALRAQVGPFTAALHGAGTNQPCPLAALDRDGFRSTLAPKLAGVRHLLAALEDDPLRLFVAFGSIIARLGVPGEADYAVANEWMTRLLERRAVAHPQCRHLAVEWSVWSGVGMGERLGRIDRLERAGVAAIAPDQGVRILRELLAQPDLPVAVVVSGRFGASPALALEAREVPLVRFLERVRLHVPGIELIADADLSLENDPYIEDHAWNGARLFPAVMGLEAMAQAARALTGMEHAPRFVDVRFERPLLLGANGRQTLRVVALARSPRVVDVALRCAETQFLVDHFRATVQFDAAAALPQIPGHGDDEALAIDPARDLYDRVMFQRGRFQRVRGYRHLRGTASAAELSPANGAAWFGPWIPSALGLGDPGARDAAIHSIQASIPHRVLLPVAVERIDTAPLPHGVPLVARARERWSRGDRFVYDLEIATTDGLVLERWSGLELRAAAPTRYAGPWPSALLGAYLERRILEAAPDGDVVAALHANGGGTAAAVRRAAGADAVLMHRADGRPELRGDPGRRVSAAHAGALTLAVAGRVEVGCDLERVTHRSAEAWHGLLGAERLALAGALATACGEDGDAACTRVWTALECLKKAGTPGAALRIAGEADEGWMVLETGRARVATFVATLEDGARVAFGLLTGALDASL